MQLVGIGFTRTDWDFLVLHLQKTLQLQISTALLGESHSYSEFRFRATDFPDSPEPLVRLRADWVLFLPRVFGEPDSCISLLEETLKQSGKDVRFVMVIENMQKDLSPFLAHRPLFELVNRMQFEISEAELLLTHHIRRFPRIRLGTDVQTLEYTDGSGKVVRKSPRDISLNTLIPLKKLLRVATKSGVDSPSKWLNTFLLKRPKPVHPEHVAGILREEKGCYLFPGIPFNSIQNLVFGKTKIEHLIRLDECSLSNPPFKRFVENIRKQQRVLLSPEKAVAGTDLLPIRCLCSYSTVNILLRNLLEEMGHANVVEINEMNPGVHILEDSVVWLKLHDFAGSVFRGSHLDWSEDLRQILKPLVHFVDLNDLQLEGTADAMPIPKAEFERLRDELLREEKRATDTKQQAQNSQLLYTQEQKILQKIERFSRMLTAALSTGRTWESATEDAPKIKMPRALLLCEDEGVASELNLLLTNVPRKLWLNPFKFQEPEDLQKFDTKIFHSYLQPEALITTADSRKHLEELCRQTFQSCRETEALFGEQKQIISQAQKELKLLRKKKNRLNLRWLNVSLKQLLYRDRHLFESLTGKNQ